MSNKKLIKRVNTLIESKNNNFKEKFYLLSYLANTEIKSDKRLMSEADCYINTLVNTNGDKPDICHVHNIVKEAIKLKKGNKYKKEFSHVKDLCKMLTSEKSSLYESLIFEELSNVNNTIDFKLNNKLKEILLESINSKKPLLINEASKTVDAADLLDSYLDGNKVANPSSGRKEDLQLDDLDDEEAYDDFDDLSTDEEDYEEEVNISRRELNKRQKELLLRYDWLLKRKNIPLIANKLKIYLPRKIKRKGVEVPVPENLENIPAIDKLAIIAKYKLIVEQSASITAMRKFEIINQIYYYLNVQKRFMDSDLAQITAMGEKDLTKDKKTRFSSSPSGLTEEEKREIMTELNKLIAKINLDDASTLNSDVVTEDELLFLLQKSVGSQRQSFDSFIDYLDDAYPTGEKTKSEEVMSDEEYEEYLRGNRELDAKEAAEDAEEFSDVPIDPETGEPMYADVDTAAKIASSYTKESDLEEIEMSAMDAIAMMRQKSQSLENVSKIVKAGKKKELTPALKRALTMELEKVQAINGVKITITPDKTKGEMHDEILAAIERPGGANEIDANTGRITSNSWNEFFDKYLNYDPEDPVSSADIARLSQGQWSGSGGVRQDLGKAWFKSLFYSSNLDIKGEIYAEIGKKFIDTARSLGLVEDDIVNMEGIRQDPVTLKKLEDLITDAEVFKEYFVSGLTDEDDEEILDYLTSGMSSFRIFTTEYLADFYANNVWNKAEADLAYAVKEYFAKKYPGSKIGENLQKGRQSKHVKKEFGKDLFNKIIYWTMGRTGIKDKGNVIANPKFQLEERKAAFMKNIPAAINDFNSEPYPNKINNFDPEHLMYDCLNDTSKVSSPYPIIGKAWSECNTLSADDRSSLIDYITSRKSKELELKFIQALMKQEYYVSTFNNPSSPLGNPAEIRAIEKGSGSEAPVDRGQPESFKGAPYYHKEWRSKIKDVMKDLIDHTNKEAQAREASLAKSRDYSFLEDDALQSTDWQVIYDGKLAEINDVDLDSGVASVIVDVVDAQGKVVDAKTIEVEIGKLRPADKSRR